MGLQDLPHIHTGRDTQRIEDDVYRGAVGKIRHIFFRHDSGNNALIAVTAGHFIAYGQLSFHGNEDFDHFNNARR